MSALALAGCAGSGAPAMLESDADAGRLAAGAQAPERQRVQRAFLGVEVEDVAAGVTAVESLAEELDGFVESQNVQADASATLALRIPAARLPEAMDRVAAFGEETYRRIDVEDVTDEVVDLDARRRNLVALRDRLRTLLDRAESVEDVLRVERELTRVQTEVDALEGRLARLRSDVDMARLEVALRKQRPKRILGPLGYVYVGARWFVEKLFVIRPGEP